MPSLVFPRPTLFLLVLFSAVSLASPFAIDQEKTANRYIDNPVIARVDSELLKISDVEDKQTNDLRKQLFNLLELQLKQAAISKLGQKHKRYAAKTDQQISDGDIKLFYEINSLNKRGSYEQLYPILKQYLEQKAEQDHINRLYASAVREGLIITFLDSPNDFVVKVPVETAYTWGNKEAPVMVLEFSDYQCPFCSKVQPTLSRLRKQFSNVVFGYRHAPLSFHREADEAAIAAECARDQGKFEEYHTLLFGRPKNQFISDLKTYARQLNLENPTAFDSCLDREKYRPRLERDLEIAARAGIKGAPGFVIGRFDPASGIVTGDILSGAQPYEVFVEIIEKYSKQLK